jgi:NADH dehydrogenase/NADH:ubiquinone oxidoreductase subunit G
MSKITLPNELINLLKNFSTINPSVLIKRNETVVRNNSKSCIGIYRYKEELPLGDVNELGLYDTGDFLSIYSAYKQPEFETNEKFITISEGKSKVKYFTTAASMIPEVPFDEKTGKYKIEGKFSKVEPEADFIIPQEKINILMKMATLLRSEYLFFESVEGVIRITVANELESSDNSWEMTIEEDVKKSELPFPVRIVLAEFRVLPVDYRVQIASAGITRWHSNVGVDYYIGLKFT